MTEVTTHRRWVLWPMLLAAAGVFAADLSVELSVAAAIPYVFVVWLASAAGSRPAVRWAAIGCSVLTVLGFFLSPDGGELAKVLANRGMALCAIWMTAGLCLHVLRLRESQSLRAEDAEERAAETKRHHEDDAAKSRAMASVLEDLKLERERLSISEQLRRLTIDAALDAVVVMDAQGTIIDWNPQAEQTFEWRADEAMGQSLVKLIIPPQYREAHQQGLERFLKTGEGPVLNQRLELSALRRNKEEFPIELTISPIKLADGYRFSAFVRDITERQTAEQNLKDRDERISSLLDSTAEGIYGIDLEGKCTFANASCARLLGYDSPDEFLGRNMHELMHHTRPEGTSYLTEMCRIDQAFRAEQGVHVDDEILCKRDGISFPSEYWSYPINRDGELTGSVVTFLDITERKQLEEAQRQLHEELEQLVDERTGEIQQKTLGLELTNAQLDSVNTRLQAILDACHRTAIIAVNPEGIVTTFSRGAERMLGYSAAEIVAKTSPAIWHLESEMQVRAEQLAAEGYGVVEGFDVFVRKAIDVGYDEHEWTFVCKDGEQRQVLLSVTRVVEQGQDVGFIGVATDITERKRDEQALREATLAAQEASRAKSEVLANMSHEIRTPMNAIMGLSEIVLDSPLRPEQRDHMQTVYDSAESLLSIINDVLDFSKIEAGKVEFERVRFNLHDVVGDTLKSLSMKAHHKHLELICFINPTLPHVYMGDPMRLRQIVTNLVGNAIKFTAAGEVVVKVTREPSDQDQHVLHFSVQDTGIGIDAGKLSTIFEAFTQADASTTRRFGGTGLGLTICHKLVNLLGGRIWAESLRGAGATFHFTLPLEPLSSTGEQQPEIATAIAGTPVLIVDDNETNRRILNEVTLAWGMQPLVVASASEALATLQSTAEAGRRLPLLLADVHMPDVDGFMLAELVRADSRLDDVAIIFLTSAGRHGDLQRCEELDVAGRLMKPIKQSELLNVIQRALGGTDVHREGRLDLVGRGNDEVTIDVDPLRILLVEDSIPNQQLVLALLSGHGHSIIVANNGREGVDAWEAEEFDLVLMDVQMPEMDGMDATRLIRERERTRDSHVPIVAMTAHALRGDREKCLAAGMDAYVPKPIRRQELFDAIVRVTGRKVVATDPGDAPASSESNLVDWSGPLRQLGGNVEVMQEIVAAYLEEIRNTQIKLPEAIAAGDAREARRLAHMLKGSMRFFGAEEAARFAEELEQRCETGDVSQADDLFERTWSVVSQVEPILNRFVETGEL